MIIYEYCSVQHVDELYSSERVQHDGRQQSKAGLWQDSSTPRG